jgi:hypothetical protein
LFILEKINNFGIIGKKKKKLFYLILKMQEKSIFELERDIKQNLWCQDIKNIKFIQQSGNHLQYAGFH